LFGWTIAGVGFGLLSGFALGQWLGGVNRARLRQVYHQWHGSDAPAGLLKPAGAARAVLAALGSDEALANLSLDAIGVGAGVVELHGWVPTRGLRARASRVAAAVPGIESLVNSILVRGEDEPPATPALDLADQSA
jgi:hypothetical protein